MAGEYNIQLSNGTLLATIHPLENDGPNNLSNNRHATCRRSFAIIQISGGNVFQVANDRTEYFPVGVTINVINSSGNNGTYVVNAAPYYIEAQDATFIEVSTVIPNPVASGRLFVNAFIIDGDMTPRFTPGYELYIINPGNPSAPNIGIYHVSAYGSYLHAADKLTIIPVDELIPEETPTLGQYLLNYKIIANTTLQLPGRGYLNYGECVLEDLVRITENWAANTSPDTNTSIGNNPYGAPLKGQLWYKTLPGEEGYKFYDGTIWSNYWDIDNGSLIFRDVEDSNKDIWITAAESNIPSSTGWASGANNQPGLIIWQVEDPPAGDAIFRVLSQNGTERLRVEHDSYVRLYNSLEVRGPNAGSDTNVEIDARVGRTARLDFRTQDVVHHQTYVDDANANHTVQIQSKGVEWNVGGVLSGDGNVLFDFTGNHTVNVGADGTGNYSQDVNGTSTIDVLGNVQETYRANQTTDVTLNQTTNIGDNYILNVGTSAPGGDLTIDVNGTSTTDVLSNVQETYRASQTTNVTNNITETAGGNYSQTITGTSTVDVTGLVTENYQSNVDTNITGNNDVDINGTNAITSVGASTFETNGSAAHLTIQTLNNTSDIGIDSARDIVLDAATAINLTAGTLINFDNYTLSVDTVNNRVGISTMAPQYALDVAGDARFTQQVGINNPPPSGSPVWLEVTGDVQVNSQIRASNQTAAAPAYTFTSNLTSGMYLAGANQLAFATNGVQRLVIQANGLLNVQGTTNYEALVAADDDLINLKYLEDNYYDETESDARFVNIDGDTMTDFLTLHADPTDDMHAATKQYVDDKMFSSSWREPVKVIDDTDYANVAAFPTGTVDGVAINTNDRVLFSGSTTDISIRDIYVWNGTAWIKDEDTIPPGQVRSVGDTVYIQQGTRFGSVYAFNKDNEWQLISGGNQCDVKRDIITGLTGTPVINFTTVSYNIGTHELFVYLNGQKVIVGTDYTETTTTSITWTGVALVATDVIEAYSCVPVITPALLPRKPLFKQYLNQVAGTTVFATPGPGGNNVDNGTATLQVFINGVLQMETIDYTYGAGNITLLVPPPVGFNLVIYEFY